MSVSTDFTPLADISTAPSPVLILYRHPDGASVMPISITTKKWKLNDSYSFNHPSL